MLDTGVQVSTYHINSQNENLLLKVGQSVTNHHTLEIDGLNTSFYQCLVLFVYSRGIDRYITPLR